MYPGSNENIPGAVCLAFIQFDYMLAQLRSSPNYLRTPFVLAPYFLR